MTRRRKMAWLKKSLSKIKNYTALCYFILVLILFLPSAITMPSLSFRSAIVTAIGVDKNDEEISVSVLALSNISKSEMNENSKLIQGTANTLANAISSLEASIGRRVRMGHVGYVVISRDFSDVNVADVLSTLIVTGNVSNTVPLLMCEGKASDVLDNALKMEQSSSYKMREMINNEFNETYTKDISIDAFLKGYYSDIGVSTLGYVVLENDKTQGIESSSQGAEQSSGQSSQSGGQSGQTSEQNNVISYKTQHAVFKDGKFAYLFTEQEMNGVNWLVENNLQKIIDIDGISEQGLVDATVTFSIQNQSIKPVVSFINGRPYITFEISLTLSPVELIQQNNTQKSVKLLKLSDNMQQKINEVIKKDVALALQKMRENKTDVIGVYRILYSHYHRFMDFLDTLADRQDFLRYVNIGVDVESFINSN